MTIEIIGSQELELIERLDSANSIIRANGVSTDMDSTVVNVEKVAINDFNRDHGTFYKITDLSDRFNMIEWAKNIPGVEDPIKYAISYWNNTERIPDLEPSPGAWLLANYFNQEQIKFHQITARPGFTKEATVLWYKRHMPWIDESLIHVQEGNEINPAFKIARIIRLGIHYHFDDAPEEAEQLSRVNVKSILVPQPWNENYETGDPNILTFDKALKYGLVNLGISNLELRELIDRTKLIVAYFILADSILS